MIVDELKKSILNYAFKGKLTLQFQDESISHSINIILKQKQELINQHKVRNEPKYEKITDDEKLFEIPNNWCWFHIGELGVFKKGPFGSALTKSIFIPDGENAIKVYEQQNAIKKNLELGNYFISKKYYEEKMKGFTINAGDIIVSCAGTIGETYIIPNDFRTGIINQALMKMTMVNELNKKYFLYYFDFILKKISNNLSSGSAIKNIPPFEIFKQLPFPLPPIEEQQRIVDKIEELFAKLDEMKPIEEELNQSRLNFPNEMKKSIFQDVLSGKLTRQNENENINNIIKFLNKYTEIKNNVPFEIPSNWIWIKFGELVDFNIGKTPARANADLWENDYNWVSISDMIENGFINNTKEKVSIKSYNDIFKGKISKKGTLLMSFKLTVGKCSILNIDAFHNEGIISIYPKYKNETLQHYLFKILPYITKYGDVKGAIKGNTLNSKSLNNLLIPLPPIEEQQRIVEKLDQLLPLCDEIEEIVN